MNDFPKEFFHIFIFFRHLQLKFYKSLLLSSILLCLFFKSKFYNQQPVLKFKILCGVFIYIRRALLFFWFLSLYRDIFLKFSLISIWNLFYWQNSPLWWLSKKVECYWCMFSFFEPFYVNIYFISTQYFMETKKAVLFSFRNFDITLS